MSSKDKKNFSKSSSSSFRSTTKPSVEAKTSRAATIDSKKKTVSGSLSKNNSCSNSNNKRIGEQRKQSKHALSNEHPWSFASKKNLSVETSRAANKSSKSSDTFDRDPNEMMTTQTNESVVEEVLCEEIDSSLAFEADVEGQDDSSLLEGEDENTHLLTASKTCDGDGSSEGSGTTLQDEIRDDIIEAAKETASTSSTRHLPDGWEEHSDKQGQYYSHKVTGIIQRDRPTSETGVNKDCILFFDDEEINLAQKTSSDDDEYYDGAALTVDESNEITFVVYPLGCCEFDETHLVSTTGTKAIQKCILRLANKPSKEETVCWGLDRSQPILMKLFDDHIQFTDLKLRTLLRSQPIQTIKTWAVDDDNNFAFVVEDKASQQTQLLEEDNLMSNYSETADYASLNEPILRCYVFSSMDDDDMSCKVAAKLNQEISKHRELMSERILKSTRVQQMIEHSAETVEQIDVEDIDELEAINESTMNVRYIGRTTVPRPTGIDVLNIAIDKCLAAASKAQDTRSMTEVKEDLTAITEAKLHVSPSSVIVENELTGEIIVECRIRYLTFMGISKRDIRWCGFIMQIPTNKTFVAHCFECHPTAGHVCEAIQYSCTKMYEKVVKSSRQQDAVSIIPSGSTIRTTLAKTFSRIKMKPVLNS